jgi:hypothetical protein
MVVVGKSSSFRQPSELQFLIRIIHFVQIGMDEAHVQFHNSFYSVEIKQMLLRAK